MLAFLSLALVGLAAAGPIASPAAAAQAASSTPALTCSAGQYLVYGQDQWDLTGSTIQQAHTFMSSFCLSSGMNTALNCTGDQIGGTRRVKQANGVYITETLQDLETRDYGQLLVQTVNSFDPDVYNATYTDFSHVSTIQVYVNQTTQAVQMKMFSNRCVSDKPTGYKAITGLLTKSKTYYVEAIPKGLPKPAQPAVKRAVKLY